MESIGADTRHNIGGSLLKPRDGLRITRYNLREPLRDSVQSGHDTRPLRGMGTSIQPERWTLITAPITATNGENRDIQALQAGADNAVFHPIRMCLGRGTTPVQYLTKMKV
jgi:hypothetical protein